MIGIVIVGLALAEVRVEKDSGKEIYRVTL
jgi:hypothetical protein